MKVMRIFRIFGCFLLAVSLTGCFKRISTRRNPIEEGAYKELRDRPNADSNSVDRVLIKPLNAEPDPKTNHDGFNLVDKVCVVVEGEPPILLSDIKRREKQRNLSFADARKSLIRETLLWVYAKKQLKYDLSRIEADSEEHENKIIKENHLTKEKYAEILGGAPYWTTIRGARRATATAILENQVRSSIAGQIVITDAQVEEEIKKIKLGFGEKYDIAFIAVMPKKSNNISGGAISAADRLTAQFKEANEIKSKISAHLSFEDIKKRYGGDEHISIIGPIAYESGVLKKAYEDRLKKEPHAIVTQPFIDGDTVTMIWKIRETALEKVRRELYERAVAEKFDSVTDSLMDSSTVMIKDCHMP